MASKNKEEPSFEEDDEEWETCEEDIDSDEEDEAKTSLAPAKDRDLSSKVVLPSPSNGLPLTSSPAHKRPVVAEPLSPDKVKKPKVTLDEEESADIPFTHHREPHVSKARRSHRRRGLQNKKIVTADVSSLNMSFEVPPTPTGPVPLGASSVPNQPEEPAPKIRSAEREAELDKKIAAIRAKNLEREKQNKERETETVCRVVVEDTLEVVVPFEDATKPKAEPELQKPAPLAAPKKTKYCFQLIKAGVCPDKESCIYSHEIDKAPQSLIDSVHQGFPTSSKRFGRRGARPKNTKNYESQKNGDVDALLAPAQTENKPQENDAPSQAAPNPPQPSSSKPNDLPPKESNTRTRRSKNEPGQPIPLYQAKPRNPPPLPQHEVSEKSPNAQDSSRHPSSRHKQDVSAPPKTSAAPNANSKPEDKHVVNRTNPSPSVPHAAHNDARERRRPRQARRHDGQPVHDPAQAS